MTSQKWSGLIQKIRGVQRFSDLTTAGSKRPQRLHYPEALALVTDGLTLAPSSTCGSFCRALLSPSSEEKPIQQKPLWKPVSLSWGHAETSLTCRCTHTHTLPPPAACIIISGSAHTLKTCRAELRRACVCVCVWLWGYRWSLPVGSCDCVTRCDVSDDYLQTAAGTSSRLQTARSTPSSPLKHTHRNMSVQTPECLHLTCPASSHVPSHLSSSSVSSG